MTVEAAIVLPILLSACYILIFPLKVLDAERKVQNAMETVAKDISIEKYMREIGEELVSGTGWESIASSLIDGMEEGFAEAYIEAVDEIKYLKVASLDIDRDSGEDGAMISMELTYEPAFPGLVFELTPSEIDIVTNRRAWIGSEGGRGRSKYGVELDEESGLTGEELSDDTEVYIARNSAKSGVYHLDPNCHYISNESIKSCDSSEIEELTNDSGAHYHACPSCDASLGGTVYYFPSGTAYHSSPDCKALTSYAETLTLKEAKEAGKHVCSYCGVTH